MNPKIVIFGKVIIWVIVMLLYTKVALLSVDNRFAYRPDWSPQQTIHTERENYMSVDCTGSFSLDCAVIPIATYATGWPLQADSTIDGNPIWLIWTINGIVMAIFGVLLAIGLRKLPPISRKNVKSKTKK